MDLKGDPGNRSHISQ